MPSMWSPSLVLQMSCTLSPSSHILPLKIRIQRVHKLLRYRPISTFAAHVYKGTSLLTWPDPKIPIRHSQRVDLQPGKISERIACILHIWTFLTKNKAQEEPSRPDETHQPLWQNTIQQQYHAILACKQLFPNNFAWSQPGHIRWPSHVMEECSHLSCQKSTIQAHSVQNSSILDLWLVTLFLSRLQCIFDCANPCRAQRDTLCHAYSHSFFHDKDTSIGMESLAKRMFHRVVRKTPSFHLVICWKEGVRERKCWIGSCRMRYRRLCTTTVESAEFSFIMRWIAS